MCLENCPHDLRELAFPIRSLARCPKEQKDSQNFSSETARKFAAQPSCFSTTFPSSPVAVSSLKWLQTVNHHLRQPKRTRTNTSYPSLSTIFRFACGSGHRTFSMPNSCQKSKKPREPIKTSTLVNVETYFLAKTKHQMPDRFLRGDLPASAGPKVLTQPFAQKETPNLQRTSFRSSFAPNSHAFFMHQMHTANG